MARQVNPHVEPHLVVRRRRAVDSAIPDGAEVRRLRMERGWSQARLIEEVERNENPISAISERSLVSIEQGRKPCRMRLLQAVAQALGCPVEQIIQGRAAIRWALMDEVLESAKSTATTGGESVLPRLLYALEFVKDSHALELELLLVLAVRRDVMGDSSGALKLASLLIAESKHAPRALFTRIRARAATFCNHLGRPSDGLKLLEPAVRAANEADHRLSEDWWALYQQGTLFAQLGHHARARKILESVRSDAPMPAHRTAALHQLGVIELRAGNPNAAVQIFQQCLDERIKASSDDVRVVYEYRRLTEAYEAVGDEKAAAESRKRAEVVLSRWSFGRYQRELTRLSRRRVFRQLSARKHRS